MTRRFTGWHMLSTMLVFFGVVIAVNVVMAREAAHTFSGEVVANSYVASQRFNRWLADARQQGAAGWRADIALDGDRYLRLAITRFGKPAAVANVEVEADQPLDTIGAAHPALAVEGEGKFRSRMPLGAGRWQVHLRATANGRTLHFERDLGA